MRVVEVEVAANDRDGQRDDQHATHCACAAHELARPRLGRHVPVADGRHGDEAPPEGDGHGGEVGLAAMHDHLDVVDDAGEEHDGDEEDEQQQHELVRARLQRVDHDLQPVRQLDEPEQPEHAHHQEHAHDVVLVEQVDVERHDGQEVEPVHRGVQELQFGRAEDEAHDELQREEHATDRLNLRQQQEKDGENDGKGRDMKTMVMLRTTTTMRVMILL